MIIADEPGQDSLWMKEGQVIVKIEEEAAGNKKEFMEEKFGDTTPPTPPALSSPLQVF